MAITRRRYSRRRLIRRRRPMRMLKAVRPYKKITNFVHRFVRWNDKDTVFSSTGPTIINTSTIADQNLSYSFKLRDVVNAVDFTSLYDQYRINKVTIYLERYRTSTGDSIAATPYSQKIRVVHDYNDNNTLTQEDDYLEYSNCKSYNTVGIGAAKIVLYPKVAQVIENVGGTQGFNSVPSNKVWLNTVDDQVPHFGLKMFIPVGGNTNGYPIFKVRARFDLSFKNSK